MVTVICDMCGKRFNSWDEESSLTIDRRMGYGSKHDGEHVHIDICANCFDKLVDDVEKARINRIGK